MDRAESSEAQVKARTRPVDHYNKVVDLAQLNHVRMLNVHYDVQTEFFDQSLKRTLSYDVSEPVVSYDAEDGRALAIVKLTVEAKHKRKKMLSCKAEYVVGYDGIEDCNEDAVSAFLLRVAPFACYPYFRSLVATLDWASGTRLPPLPIHKEQPKSKETRMNAGPQALDAKENNGGD